jgi:hypothetical protein
MKSMFTLIPNESEISIDISSYYKRPKSVCLFSFDKKTRRNKNKSFSSKIMNKFIFQIILNSFLVSFLLTGSFYLFNTIYKYYKFEIITKYEVVNEYKSQFPAVTICDTDRPASWNSYYPKILKCSFDSDEDCLDHFENYFITYNDSIYSKCYRFNSGMNEAENSKILNTSRNGGDSTGFLLELIAPSSKDYSRLKVFIHNQTLNPESIYNKGFYISSGSKNYFSVKRIFNKKISQPDNECLVNVFMFQNNRTIIEYMKERNQKYNNQECLDLCERLKFIETNNCSVEDSKLLQDNLFLGSDLVLNETLMKCVEEFKNNFEFKQCDKYCPNQCVTVKYDVSHIFENIPGTGNVKFNPSFSEFENYDEIKRGFFSIRIFYESNEYIQISQEYKINIDQIITCFGLMIVLLNILLTIITFRINFLIK